MDQHNNPSPSFINIAVLLLFAIVIAVVSAVTTYFFLTSRPNEQYSASQPSFTPKAQNVAPLGFTYYVDADCFVSFLHPDYLLQEPGLLQALDSAIYPYASNETVSINCQKDVVQKTQQEIRDRAQKPEVINSTTYTSSKPVQLFSLTGDKYTRYYDEKLNLDVGTFYNPHNKKWVVVQSSPNLSTLVFQTLQFHK